MNALYPADHELFNKSDTYSLRGICMILIIIHHIYHYIANYYGYVWENSLFSYCVNSVGYWSTAFFFLLSGYGINCSLTSKVLDFSYVKTHFLNLLLPYFYALLISVILTGNLSMFSSGWFYKTILALYVITFAIYHLIRRPWVRLAIISALVVIYIVYANQCLSLMRYYTNSIICFPIGILCSISCPPSKNKYMQLILLCVGFIFFVGIEKLGFSYADYVLAILFSFICIYLVSIINIKCGFFDYIGKKSIMFYVLQIALLESLLRIKSPIIYCIAVCALMWLLTYVYYTAKARFRLGK